MNDPWLSNAQELIDPTKLRHGALDDDHAIGPERAEICVVGYGNYVCPYSILVQELIEEIRVELPQLRLVQRHLYCESRHRGADRVAQLAEAAGALGSFWRAHSWLQRNALTAFRMPLGRIAEALELPVEPFAAATLSPWVRRRVRRDLVGAQLLALPGSPSYLINGRVYEGLWRVKDLREAIAIAGDRAHRARAATVRPMRWREA